MNKSCVSVHYWRLQPRSETGVCRCVRPALKAQHLAVALHRLASTAQSEIDQIGFLVFAEYELAQGRAWFSNKVNAGGRFVLRGARGIQLLTSAALLLRVGGISL